MPTVDNKQYLLPTDYRGTGPFRPVTQWMNRVGTLLNNLHFLRGGSVDMTKDFIRLRAAPSTNATFDAQITEWNAGTTDYTWHTLQRKSDNSGWENSAGSSSTGSSYGKKDSNNARHEAGVANLPCTDAKPLYVRMRPVTDADGDLQYLFHVPFQVDATFAHRATAGGSPTLGDRADRSKTEAELKQATGTFEPQTEYGVESQTDGKHGWVLTVVNGVGYDTSAHDFIIQFKDVEYDVMGRFVSESETFETQLIDLEAC